jgi:flagellar biosynthetic protein FliR
VIDIGFEAQKFILVFIRITAIIWLLPLFQSRSVSAVYKAGLALIIAFLLFRSVSAPDLRGDGYLMLLAVGQEMLIGLSIGFFIRILFSMVSAAGEVISMQSGLSFARSVDPSQVASVTVIEHFQSLLTMMIFLGIDGHHTVIKGISASFRQVPPGSVAIRPELFHYLISSVNGLFSASLRICAPIVATIFLADLALGILARLIPQVNVFIEGASIKILITLALLAISLNLIVPVIGGLFRNMDSDLLRIFRYAV